MSDASSPDGQRDLVDRGDDTQRRFFYQYCCILMLLGALLDDAPEYECFFCEQFDDLLGRRPDGKFAAFQVKSRESKFGPLTTGNAEFRQWIAHFCKLEERFSGAFELYVLCYSNGFRDDGTYDSPATFAQKVSACDPARTKTTDVKKLNELAAQISCSPTTLQSVLAKTRFQKVPELESVEAYVFKRHFLLMSKVDMQVSGALNAFNLLVHCIMTACNLTNSDPREDRVAMYMDPEAVRTDAVLRGKRVDRSTLIAWLEDCSDEVPRIILNDYDPKRLSDIAKGTGRLTQKFSAGSLSVKNLQLAEKLKGAAEDAFLSLRHLVGEVDAEKVYASLSLVVQNQCQEVWDEQMEQFEQDGQAFGTRMLIDVRRRLQTRSNEFIPNRARLTYEHLLGLSYMLTEECEVWWSPHFDLEGTQ